MPVTASLGQLTTTELNSLLTSVGVMLNFPDLVGPIAFAKLDTLKADLTWEKEDRERLEGESRAHARTPRGLFIA